MPAKKTMAQRLGQALETVTRQCGQLPETPAYGSWLLGRVSESPSRRWVRIKRIVTVYIMTANLTGIVVALLVVTFAFPVPSIYTDAPWWVTFGVAPAYATLALAIGTYWITTRIVRASIRWAIEERAPSQADGRNTLLLPFRVAAVHLILWDIGGALLATLYGLANRVFVTIILFSVTICGVLVATNCYLFTEFALRPVAAKALEAGRPPRRFAPGIMGRTILMWILAWLTATPVRVVRAALRRVERGELRTNLVVFDGTELGELQRGFNAMVAGLRERERVRDLFGRHVGREVAAAAERERSKLGGEERHVAVVFIDIVGSTQLVTSRPPADVVKLLNKFFAIVVDEVDRHHGLVNKFEGDASLTIFGAPNRLPCPEDKALAAARAIADRLVNEMPECQAGIGVAAGQVIAGNVGARERFEYTVIGEPVNEAARLCELAKSRPGKLLASAQAVDAASEEERARWSLGRHVKLRGHDQPVRLAKPVGLTKPRR